MHGQVVDTMDDVTPALVSKQFSLFARCSKKVHFHALQYDDTAKQPAIGTVFTLV